MKPLWIWLPYIIPVLGVSLYCAAQVIRDIRVRNLKWAVMGGVCAAIMLTAAASIIFMAGLFLVSSTPPKVEVRVGKGYERSPMFAAVRVAERAVAAKYPDFDTIQNPPIIHENDKTWRVYYELPDGVIGGTPELEIDKATLEVISVEHSQ